MNIQIFLIALLLYGRAAAVDDNKEESDQKQQQPPAQAIVKAGDGSENSTQAQPQILLDIGFVHDFRTLFNPKNASTPFQWLKYSTDKNFGEKCAAIEKSQNIFATSGDNAAFVFSSPEFLDMASLPFARWLPPSVGINATCAAHDAAVLTKEAIDLKKDQLLRVRLSVACETFNVAAHEFPAGAVTDALNDPRLAACGMFVRDDDKSGLNFGFLLTNRGIWAVYGRSLRQRYLTQGKYRAFSAYRLVGSRNHSADFVDVRLAVNNAARETRYFLGSQVVWSVGDWGVLNENVRNSSRIVSEVDGDDEQVMSIDKATFYIENDHVLDVKDPNAAAKDDNSSRGLVRLTSEKDYYGASAKFWDEDAERERCLFGQGVRTSLRRLQIDRT